MHTLEVVVHVSRRRFRDATHHLYLPFRQEFTVKRGPAKANLRYIRRAAKRFLEGTRCHTPEEAVLKGFRTL